MSALKFDLYEEPQAELPAARGEVSVSKTAVDISVAGYGVAGMEDGWGSVVFLEHWDGKLRLVVFADITREDPTHIIDLSGAKESLRPPEDV